MSTATMSSNGARGGDHKPKLPSFDQLISQFDQNNGFSMHPERRVLLVRSLDDVAQAHHTGTSAIDRDDPRRGYQFPARPSVSAPPPIQAPAFSAGIPHQQNNNRHTSYSGDFGGNFDEAEGLLLLPRRETQPRLIHRHAGSLHAFPPSPGGRRNHRKTNSASLVETRLPPSPKLGATVEYGLRQERPQLHQQALQMQAQMSSEISRSDRESMMKTAENVLSNARQVTMFGEHVWQELALQLNRGAAERFGGMGAVGPGEGDSDVLRLSNNYGNTGDKMSFRAADQFLENVALPLLQAASRQTKEMSDDLDRWIQFRRAVPRPPIATAKRASTGEVKKPGHHLHATVPRRKDVFINYESPNRSRQPSTSIAPSRPMTNKTVRTSGANFGLNSELSVAKKMVCLQCGETETPEWRRGPNGVRTLCNACGLFHGKLIKKVGLKQAGVIMQERRLNGQSSDRRIPSEEDDDGEQ